MSVWEEDPSHPSGLRHTKTFLCPYCGTRTRLIGGIFTEFRLNFDLKAGELAHHIDMYTWCGSCGYSDRYGIAISKEHYDKLDRKINSESNKETV